MLSGIAGAIPGATLTDLGTRLKTLARLEQKIEDAVLEGSTVSEAEAELLDALR